MGIRGQKVRTGRGRNGERIGKGGQGVMWGAEGGDVVEGDVVEGDVVEGDVVEGDVVEGDVVEGDVVEGDVVEGDVVEGDVVEGDVVEGDVGEGDVVEGDVVEGDVGEGDVVEGDVVEGDVVEGDVGEGDVVEENRRRKPDPGKQTLENGPWKTNPGTQTLESRLQLHPIKTSSAAERDYIFCFIVSTLSRTLTCTRLVPTPAPFSLITSQLTPARQPASRSLFGYPDSKRIPAGKRDGNAPEIWQSECSSLREVP
ncbi:hypothetical protein Pcinc_038169 [Petrolisthes cinctipes]|uniref:Uncharacterized protein n=1 Tax=Petrolisthes cinctipes TaxID=88211 RepID=A0AAE1BR97_PETCI|nr:hypothetical protein Pcinc_038169 [Petrolisthes cinctipes]